MESEGIGWESGWKRSPSKKAPAKKAAAKKAATKKAAAKKTATKKAAAKKAATKKAAAKKTPAKKAAAKKTRAKKAATKEGRRQAGHRKKDGGEADHPVTHPYANLIFQEVARSRGRPDGLSYQSSHGRDDLRRSGNTAHGPRHVRGIEVRSGAGPRCRFRHACRDRARGFRRRRGRGAHRESSPRYSPAEVRRPPPSARLRARWDDGEPASEHERVVAEVMVEYLEDPPGGRRRNRQAAPQRDWMPGVWSRLCRSISRRDHEPAVGRGVSAGPRPVTGGGDCDPRPDGPGERPGLRGRQRGCPGAC